MKQDSGRTLRAAIVRALDALDLGDQRDTCEILLAALEDGPTLRPYSCVCGQRFEWPGLLDHHERLCATYDQQSDLKAAA